MRTLLLMLLAACSCSTLAPKPDEQKTGCYTKCGLYADRLPDGWTCNDLQRVEAATVDSAVRLVKDKPALGGAIVCSIHDYTLHIVSKASWEANGYGEILGLTSCKARRIFINNVPVNETPLVHEYMHVFQGCSGEHKNWKTNGIDDAIADALSRL